MAIGSWALEVPWRLGVGGWKFRAALYFARIFFWFATIVFWFASTLSSLP